MGQRKDGGERRCLIYSFSVPEDTYVHAHLKAKDLNISANQLAKGVFLRWLESDEFEDFAEIMEALAPDEDKAVPSVPRLFE